MDWVPQHTEIWNGDGTEPTRNSNHWNFQEIWKGITGKIAWACVTFWLWLNKFFVVLCLQPNLQVMPHAPSLESLENCTFRKLLKPAFQKKPLPTWTKCCTSGYESNYIPWFTWFWKTSEATFPCHRGPIPFVWLHLPSSQFWVSTTCYKWSYGALINGLIYG